MTEDEMAEIIRSMASSLERLANAMEVLIDQIEESVHGAGTDAAAGRNATDRQGH